MISIGLELAVRGKGSTGGRKTHALARDAWALISVVDSEELGAHPDACNRFTSAESKLDPPDAHRVAKEN